MTILQEAHFYSPVNPAVADCYDKTAAIKISKTQSPHAHGSNVVEYVRSQISRLLFWNEWRPWRVSSVCYRCWSDGQYAGTPCAASCKSWKLCCMYWRP